MIQESLRAETQHARDAVTRVKQQQAHIIAQASKAEEGAVVSEQSHDKFVRENTERKQKLQDSDRIAAAADLLAKHTKAHTDKDELQLQLQVRSLSNHCSHPAHEAAGYRVSCC